MRDKPARRTASASAPTLPRSTTLRWAGPIFRCGEQHHRQVLECRPTPQPRARRISYIPEIPWNDSCAGSVLATYMGYSDRLRRKRFLQQQHACESGNIVVAAGSGGPSNCATGAPATYGVSSGTCQGYAKPTWQTGVSGIPKDGVRDIPDVSMFASDGVWGHYAVLCFSDPDNGGTPCTGSPSNWAGVGGTSVASPIMAGVQALVNQNEGRAAGQSEFCVLRLGGEQRRACSIASPRETST